MNKHLLFLILISASPLLMAQNATDKARIERGRYIIATSGCNDCHTAGYIDRSAKVPVSEWLMGDTMGWSGPWGTTYASNLRLRLADMDLPAWKTFARSAVLRPPMPYWALNAMTDEDLEAIWAFTRSLGKGGENAPAALPPDVEAPLPYFKLHLPPAPAKQ